MITSELIKLLQEADPEGTTHISIGGVVTHVYREDGYYDGPYHYMDEEGRYTISTRGKKVFILFEDLCDYVQNLMMNAKEVPTLDEVLKDIVFDLGGSSKSFYVKRIELYYNEGIEILNKVKGWNENR
jgi:hypothetical protein